MSSLPPIKQFLRHESEFMGYLMAMTRDFEAAEEIFQNAAVIVMEKAGKGEAIHDFRAWAKEVVRRQALHYFREASQRRSISTNSQLLEQISASFLEDETDDVSRERELRALRRCLESVQPEHRRMIAMRYENRGSFETIGNALGRTSAAVQRALSRARKSLLRCIQQQKFDLETGVFRHE
jgi:RNA polymerase sigma-70 factor, ECF subfamily